MALCSKCMTENPPTNKFCAECGIELNDEVAATVERNPEQIHGVQFAAGDGPSSSRHGRFEPGTRLGNRYRVVGLLGKGGMGEVYRADDLELGQSVALKFLPQRLTSDPVSLQRFRNEVRTAREIAHPNVCRIYDIGEVDGHVFLSMEYIDGEDLSQVLRRMGRPSKEKALEIARQLCLGLAAAHEAGILHRDLKPANVMIDGRGRVRITDFGLAGLIDELQESDEIAGTPAYMAPEQLSSATVSIQSDLYSLGLVFFEIFTGGRVYETNNIAELRELHSSSSVASASSVTEEVDPIVDRVIRRCLDKDPQRRPSSVYAVLGALPGADPLTAALAAGETPSPELVAEAGESAIISTRAALACLIGAILLMGIGVGLRQQHRIDRYVPLNKSADDLVFVARELLSDLGYPELPQYRAHGFSADSELLDYLTKNDKSPDRWDRLSHAKRPAVLFWFRISPEPLRGTELHNPHVGRKNPPLSGRENGLIELDAEGNLVHLAVVPSDTPVEPVSSDDPGVFSNGTSDIDGAEPKQPENLRRVLAAAGFDPNVLVPSEPITPPAVYCDQLWSFTVKGEETEGTIRSVQVGAYRGRINSFTIETPWIEKKSVDRSTPPLPIFLFMVCVVVLVIGTAMRNLNLGRGDRRGAFRLALFIVTTMLVGWSINGIAESGTPFNLFGNLVMEIPMGHALHHAMIGWLMYVAVEPFARRWWPSTLVTWTRVLMGRLSDVQVGRDILVGGVLAGALSLITWLTTQTVVRFGGLLPIPVHGFLSRGLELGMVMESRIGYAHQAIVQPLAILVLLVFARVLIRNQWAACAAVLCVLMAISVVVNQQGDVTSMATRVVGDAAWFAALLFVLVRFGVFATAVSGFILAGMSAGVTWDLSRWYAVPALSGLVPSVALLAFGFYTSLGGRPLLRDESS